MLRWFYAAGRIENNSSHIIATCQLACSPEIGKHVSVTVQVCSLITSKQVRQARGAWRRRSRASAARVSGAGSQDDQHLLDP